MCTVREVCVPAEGDRGNSCEPGTAAIPDGMRGEIVGDSWSRAY